VTALALAALLTYGTAAVAVVAFGIIAAVAVILPPQS
jgi:hypothetical protein